MPVATNITLARARQPVAVRRARLPAASASWPPTTSQRLGIKTRVDPLARVDALGRQPAEGGAGRWLATKPAVLILDEPTQGIDVGAKAEIHG